MNRLFEVEKVKLEKDAIEKVEFYSQQRHLSNQELVTRIKHLAPSLDHQ